MTKVATNGPAPGRPISVVVASGAGGEFLFRCLASLRQQQVQPAEIIVVDRTGPSTLARLQREFPTVRTIATTGDHRATVPEMRRIGLEAAQSEIVAVLEEHCTAPPDWIATIASEFRPGDAAIGGPIRDSGFRRRLDWVVYFSEYHNYLPPWPDGDRFLLSGANIAYDRRRVLQHRGVLDSGYWEVVLHPLLVRDGAFRALDRMGAHHTGPFAFAYYLHQRYLLSRVWGSMQRERESLPRRLIHLLAAPVFPAFLFARVTRRVLENGRLLKQYALALPLLLPVWIAYTWGEWLGYLIGPGTALQEVE